MRESAWIILRQPIVSEARHYAASHKHDQSDQRGNTDPDAVVCAAMSKRFDMKNNVARDQQGKHYENTKIAPVIAGDDLGDSHCGNCQKEADVDRGGEPGTANGGACNRYASDQP